MFGNRGAPIRLKKKDSKDTQMQQCSISGTYNARKIDGVLQHKPSITHLQMYFKQSFPIISLYFLPCFADFPYND